MSWVLCVATALVAVASCASAQGGKVSAVKGATERWTFVQNGIEIGKQTAECTAVRGALSDWQFQTVVSAPAQGKMISISMNGTFTIAADGKPVAMALQADANGVKQQAAYTFAGKKVTAKVSAGGQGMTRDVALSGSETLQLNNVITLMSITTQSLRPQAGKTCSAPVFAAGALQTLNLTLTALAKTETITAGGKRVECVVVDAAPIANRLWCDVKTGELMKVAATAQGLVIERR